MFSVWLWCLSSIIWCCWTGNSSCATVLQLQQRQRPLKVFTSEKFEFSIFDKTQVRHHTSVRKDVKQLFYMYIAVFWLKTVYIQIYLFFSQSNKDKKKLKPALKEGCSDVKHWWKRVCLLVFLLRLPFWWNLANTYRSRETQKQTHRNGAQTTTCWETNPTGSEEDIYLKMFSNVYEDLHFFTTNMRYSKRADGGERVERVVDIYRTGDSRDECGADPWMQDGGTH